MGLKHTIVKLEDVAENVRPLYKQEGDKYVLDVEGVVPKERVDEFRNNNIQLQQALEKLKGVDPVKYAELIQLDNEVKEGKLIKEGKLEEVVNLRVGQMKTTYETTINETKSALEIANSQLQLLMIDNQAKNEALKLGVRPEALDDIVLRARALFKLEKGVPVPKDDKGNVIYGKDGTTPQSMADWTVGLKKTAPHLFQGSQGSGAGGGNGTGTLDYSKMTPAQKITAGIAAGGLLANLPKEVQ